MRLRLAAVWLLLGVPATAFGDAAARARRELATVGRARLRHQKAVRRAAEQALLEACEEQERVLGAEATEAGRHVHAEAKEVARARRRQATRRRRSKAERLRRAARRAIRAVAKEEALEEAEREKIARRVLELADEMERGVAKKSKKEGGKKRRRRFLLF